MRHAGKEPFPTIYVDSKDDSKTYDVAAKSQLKKIQKIWVRESYKAADKAKVEEKKDEQRVQNLEEAKKIILEQDPTLPKAKTIKIIAGKFHHCFISASVMIHYEYILSIFKYLKWALIMI